MLQGGNGWDLQLLCNMIYHIMCSMIYHMMCNLIYRMICETMYNGSAADSDYY